MRLHAGYYPTVLLTAMVAGGFSLGRWVIGSRLRPPLARSGTRPARVSGPQRSVVARAGQHRAAGAGFARSICGCARNISASAVLPPGARFCSRADWSFCLLAARLAVTLQRKLPMPTGEPSREDPDARVAGYGILQAVATAGSAVGRIGFRAEHGLPRDAARQSRGTGRFCEPSRNLFGGFRRCRRTNGRPSPTCRHPERSHGTGPAFVVRGATAVQPMRTSPTAWDAPSGQGIVWKSPVPLPGNNSPVVWGEHVFLTGANAKRREIYCFDANTGALRWQREIRRTSQGATPPEVSEETGYAAPTSATDGRRVYAMFANGDVAAVDFSGNTVWTVGLGTPKNIYGHAASLALCRNLLIVQFDQGSAKEGKSQLLALQTATGQSAWKTDRDVPNSWSSPIVIGDQDQARIITSASPWVIAYRAADGVELWRSKSLRADVGPSPVHADGIVYVVSEFPCLSAIRTGGKGDITKTHVAWTADAGLSDTCGPLVTDQFVLLLASFGTLTCYDKQVGGEPLWEMDFDDSFSSSPGLVGNRVYLFGEEGKAWVVEVGRDEGKLIAESDLGQPCVTSPAFQEGRIYIRGKESTFVWAEVKGKRVGGMME